MENLDGLHPYSGTAPVLGSDTKCTRRQVFWLVSRLVAFPYSPRGGLQWHLCRADRLETYSSGSAQDLHLFPSYSDERVSIGSPSLQRYVFSDLHLHFFLRRIRRLVCRAGGEEISFGAETINDESPTSVPTKYTIKGIKCTPWFGAYSKEFGRGKGQKLQRTPARSSLPRRR